MTLYELACASPPSDLRTAVLEALTRAWRWRQSLERARLAWRAASLRRRPLALPRPLQRVRSELDGRWVSRRQRDWERAVLG